MFARLTGLFLAKQKEPRFTAFTTKLNLEKLKQSSYFKLRRFPWLFWNLGFILLCISVYLSYIVYTKKMYVYYNNAPYSYRRSIITIGTNIILYYIYFIILYAGTIEVVTIDKKKGIIKQATINIFLSKKEKYKQLDDIKDIEILRKGIIRRGGGDTVRFYIRITFSDEDTMVFGECITLNTISMKYRQCMAILKELIVPDIISGGFITDETIDENLSED